MKQEQQKTTYSPVLITAPPTPPYYMQTVLSMDPASLFQVIHVTVQNYTSGMHVF